MFESNENLSKSCLSPEDIVAYVYDEMNDGSRGLFEHHLADCDACTSELAELSLARLDVYEWHRDEFVPMETPRIAVPYERPAKASWLDGVRALVTVPGRLAMAGGAFGLIAVAVMGTYLAFRPAAGDLPMENVAAPVSVQRHLPSARPASNNEREPEVKKAAKELTEKTEKEELDKARPNPVSVPERKTSTVGRPAGARMKQAVERPLQKRTVAPAPRLNDFEDEEDRTLRLGDLLAEVDTRD